MSETYESIFLNLKSRTRCELHVKLVLSTLSLWVGPFCFQFPRCFFPYSWRFSITADLRRAVNSAVEVRERELTGSNFQLGVKCEWPKHDNTYLSSWTPLGSGVTYGTFKEAVDACLTLSLSNCGGITRTNTGYQPRKLSTPKSSSSGEISYVRQQCMPGPGGTNPGIYYF